MISKEDRSGRRQDYVPVLTKGPLESRRGLRRRKRLRALWWALIALFIGYSLSAITIAWRTQI